MKKLLGIVVLSLILIKPVFADKKLKLPEDVVSDIEKRVSTYEDDGYEAWFTFKQETRTKRWATSDFSTKM